MLMPLIKKESFICIFKFTNNLFIGWDFHLFYGHVFVKYLDGQRLFFRITA